MKLYADKEAWMFMVQHPVQWLSFGCGPGGWGDWLVPDTIYGLSVIEACRIHDWYYRFYWQDTEGARERADKILLNNMIRIIEAGTGNRWLLRLRLHRARLYYRMVRDYGAPAYFEHDRNSDVEYREVESE
jgi:hypothetical protein